jgi:putative oxidoreductase
VVGSASPKSTRTALSLTSLDLGCGSRYVGEDLTHGVRAMDERRSMATDIVFSCLRVVGAWVYLQHGLQKMFGVLGGFGPNGATAHFPGLFGWAGLIEITCGIAILLGLFTRITAFIASGEMAVAYFMAHAPNSPVFTVLNHGEVPAILAFLFLYFALVGPGAFSMDALIANARRNSTAPEPQRT